MLLGMEQYLNTLFSFLGLPWILPHVEVPTSISLTFILTVLLLCVALSFVRRNNAQD